MGKSLSNICITFKNLTVIFFFRLGSIGLPWQDIPLNIRATIEDVLLLRIKEFTNIGLSGFLFGCIGMKYRWFDDARVRDEVYRRIIDLYGSDRINATDGKNLANIIYAMGKGGLTNNELSEEILKVLLEGVVSCKSSINAKNISNIIYG
jgi:hypothetical protein